ncbi:chemotaxis protein CheB [Lichenibacterium minor]|uniref:protein-glutamate methylesterase n=1 Tax=Lichenibacterium minor TaxID=2316528 RepID=A0A4Q2U2M8_9HYPH|nr:chemotaxis protein CheB [Lichenibacterium minor]RYC28936.1 chemotaxis protein CheB [Lichenibacterium minor]
MGANPATSTSPAPWFVAVGASGPVGLDDIGDLLRELPRSLNAVVLVVLHRPWDRVSHLGAVLSRSSRMPVIVASDGEPFKTGRAYVGGPAEHLTLATKSFGSLVQDPHRRYRNRTVDLLLMSLAEHAGARSIGVILSGFLDDGSRGLAAIHHAGGLTMVLKPSGSPTPGMPENAISYDGPIDVIGSPEEIAHAITAMVAGS